MKLKQPEMFKPAWWAKNSNLRVNGDAGAEAMKDAVSVSFPVKENAKGEVVIASHSTLEIRHYGHNDPDWRRKISSIFGVHVRLANEFAGSLWCPHTAKKVSVSRIKDNAVLWVDLEARTAMKCHGLKYDSPDGAPVPGQGVIEYSFSNKNATDAFMARLMPILREAKMRCALLELKPEFDRKGMLQFLKSIHKDMRLVDVEGVLGAPTLRPHTDMANSYMCVLAWGLDKVACDKDFIEFIKDLCADHYKSPYLEYRE